MASAGFDLSHPYVELCWGPIVGPSATLLLRRMPLLWTERVPAVIAHGELARSLGLGGGTGDTSRLMHSIDRLVRHRAAEWTPGRVLAVYRSLPGLGPHQLERLPEWTREVHHVLLDRHVRDLQTQSQTVASGVGGAGVEDPTEAKVRRITERLDRLQRPRGIDPPAPSPTSTGGFSR